MPTKTRPCMQVINHVGMCSRPNPVYLNLIIVGILHLQVFKLCSKYFLDKVIPLELLSYLVKIYCIINNIYILFLPNL